MMAVSIYNDRFRIQTITYILSELTANKWQVVMESPIASGADPFVAAAACSSAAEPKTTRIRTKVMKNSIPSPYK